MDHFTTEIHLEELQTMYGLFMANHTVSNKKMLLHVFLAIEETEYTGVLDATVRDYLRGISIAELMNIESKDISNIYLDMHKALISKIKNITVKPDVIDTPKVSGFDTEPSLPSNFKETASKISKQATKNDKMSWWRLQRELKILLNELDELNLPYFEYHQKVKEAVSNLENMYSSVIDKREHVLKHIDDITIKMKAECIHPADQIAYVCGEYHCKFCDTKINLLEAPK